MVLAEIFSLLLYLLSLVILHDYFGKPMNMSHFFKIHANLKLPHLIFIFSWFVSRLGLHLVIRIFVESIGNHACFVSAAVYYKIFTKEIFTASLCKIVLEFIKEMSPKSPKNNENNQYKNLARQRRYTFPIRLIVWISQQKRVSLNSIIFPFTSNENFNFDLCFESYILRISANWKLKNKN